MTKKSKDSIYDTLKMRIIELQYLPGHLFNERELINEFNVSRTPIREVFLRLSEENLVEVVPRVGTYVAQINLQKVKNAYELKKKLESLAAELASQRADRREMETLVDLAKSIESYDPNENYKDLIIADQLFHKLIRQYSKNEWLIEILEDLNVQTERFLRQIEYKLRDPKWYYDSISSIVEAICSRDSQSASDEAEKHTQMFLDQLFRNFFS